MLELTSRRARGGLIQRRDVKIQRRDVPEKGLIQSRDVEIQRRDVPEKGQTDVATLKRRDVETSRRLNVMTLKANVAM